MRYCIIVRSGKAVLSDGKQTDMHTEDTGHAVYGPFNEIVHCEQFIMIDLAGMQCEIAQWLDQSY